MITVDEDHISNLIVDVWENYLKLEKQHPNDLEEFHRAIHDLQKLMAIRIVRRLYPEKYPIKR